MPLFPTQPLASWSEGRWHGSVPRFVRGFSIDSRTLQPGDLFVALTTEKRDGHEYIAAAADRGAAAALVRAVDTRVKLPQLRVEDSQAALQVIARRHRETFAGPVIGITGSCGKTSTKEILARLLGGKEVHRTPGNLNNRLGVPLSLLGIDPMVHHSAVIEAGAGAPDDIAILAGLIRPTSAIITGVGPAHLETLGTLDDVAREKASLGKAVPPSGLVLFPQACLAYPHFDHFLGQSVASASEGRPLVPRRRIHRAFYRVAPAESGNPRESRLWIRQAPAPYGLFTVPWMTAGMMENCVLAITMARWLGVSDDRIARRLGEWRPGMRRGELLRCGESQYYVDCYNANPQSMQDALEAFRRCFGDDQPRLYVLGCMAELGAQSDRFHEELGRSLPLREHDRAIVMGDEALALARGLRDAGAGNGQIRIAECAAEARGEVTGFHGSVFLKGSRIHQLETVLPEACIPFDQPESVAC